MRIAILNRFSKDFYDYNQLISTKKDNIIFYNSNKKFFESTDNITVKNYEGFDKAFFLDIIRDHKKQPFDRLIALSEYDIERVSDIRKYLNIPSFEPISSYIFRDKYLMKNFFSTYIRTPKYKDIKNFVDIISFIDENGYPVVIKPRLGSGSESIVILSTDEELKKYLSQSPELNQLMIEEYIDGEMYHIDGVVNCGELFYISSKYINGCLAFSENNFLGSFGIENLSLKKKIDNFMKKMFSPFISLKSSFIFHLEIFKKDEEFLLCEIASRLGGGYIHDILMKRSNQNMLDAHLEIEINGYLKNIPNFTDNNYGFIMLPYRKGILASNKNFYDSRIIKIDWDSNLIGHCFDTPDSSIDHYIGYVFECTGLSEKHIYSFMVDIADWHEKHTIWKNIE